MSVMQDTALSKQSELRLAELQFLLSQEVGSHRFSERLTRSRKLLSVIADELIRNNAIESLARSGAGIYTEVSSVSHLEVS
jgi:hypothetical protein